MSAQRYLFVSCASADKPRLTPIFHALLERGFELWIDNPYDLRLAQHPGVHRMAAGQSWKAAIDEALEIAACVLVFWSRDSVLPERRLLHEEAALALRHGNLIQVLIDDVARDLPIGFSQQQAVDLIVTMPRLAQSSDPRLVLDSDPNFRRFVEDISVMVDNAATHAIRSQIEARVAAVPMPPLVVPPTPRISSGPFSAFRVFVNYRKSDCGWPAISLHGKLAHTFGEDAVFLDVHGLSPGDEYAGVLVDTVNSCAVFLAMIGRGWIDARDDTGRRRFDDPEDWVRTEIKTALESRVRVIPILVDGVEPPKADRLPEDIKPIAGRQCVPLDKQHFGRDMGVLVDCLRRNRDARNRLSSS